MRNEWIHRRLSELDPEDGLSRRRAVFEAARMGRDPRIDKALEYRPVWPTCFHLPSDGGDPVICDSDFIKRWRRDYGELFDLAMNPTIELELDGVSSADVGCVAYVNDDGSITTNSTSPTEQIPVGIVVATIGDGATVRVAPNA